MATAQFECPHNTKLSDRFRNGRKGAEGKEAGAEGDVSEGEEAGVEATAEAIAGGSLGAEARLVSDEDEALLAALERRRRGAERAVDEDLYKACFGSNCDVSKVNKKQINGCRLRFNSTRDAGLYGLDQPVHASISADGVISAVGIRSILFMEVDGVKTENTVEGLHKSLEQQVAKRVHERNYKELHNDHARHPGRNGSFDHMTALCGVSQGNISLPVLEYKGTVCIDYSADTPVLGMCIYDGEKCSPVITQTLYTIPAKEDLIMIESGDVYVRIVDATEAPKTMQAARKLENSATNALFKLTALRAREGGDDERALAETPDTSLIGGFIPLCICNGEYRVARIGELHGSAETLTTTSHPTIVDAAMLAGALSADSKTNSIGIAMQKIPCGEQGDLMLHDGM